MPFVEHKHLPMPQIMNIQRLFYRRKYAENFHNDVNNEMICIINGAVRLSFESGQEFYGEKNDILFVPRATRHRDIFEVRTGLEAFHINFKWRLADEMFAQVKPDFMKTLSPKDKNEVLLLIDMFRLDQYRSAENISVAECRFAHLLGIAWRHAFSAPQENSGADSYSRLAAFAFSYMVVHLAENITIDSVAAYLNVSRSTLIRVFRHAGGMTFTERLRIIRMNEAYSMLRERGMNVAECASRCGYQDPAYFSRVFKKHFGFSPNNLK